MADALKHGSTVRSTENALLYETVLNQLLEEVKKVYRETGKVSDEILSALNGVTPVPLLKALDLVDSKSVTMVIAPSGRSLYQVVGSSGTPYTCFTTSLYCSCPAYRFSVLKKQEHTMCKHMLAIKLSEAMGVTSRLDVSDKEITDMILQMD